MSILPLPDTVREQVKSSTRITTLSDVVEELFKNSLDADAATVEIEVDFAKGFCSIKDDGVGIPALDLSHDGNFARPNCEYFHFVQSSHLTSPGTSKLNAPHSYGRRGCFLSCLSSLSLTSIVSRHAGAEAASSAFLGQSTVLSRQAHTEDSELNGPGTRVFVHNLFGNLPVRFKHLALRYASPSEEEKAFEDLKRRIAAFLLASAKHLNLRLATRDRRLKYAHHSSNAMEETPKSAFTLPMIESVLRQASLTSPFESSHWRLASAKAGGISIRAAICLNPSPSKQCQFVALGHFPIPCSGTTSLIYDTINKTFEASHFGALGIEDKTASVRSASRTVREYKHASLKGKMAKGVDRWPRFYVRIDTRVVALLDKIQCPGADGEDVPPAIQPILDLLTTLLLQFLQSQNLKPKGNRPSRASAVVASASPDREHGARSPSVYENWKRLKHSTHLRSHDAQNGLPFASKDDPPISDIVLGNDIRLLLGDMDLDPEASGALSNRDSRYSIHFSQSTSDELQHCDEQIVSWTDPRTGQLLLVNLDNGFVLPSAPSDSSCEAPARPSDVHTTRNVRCLPRPSSSRAELAERLKNWPSPAFQSSSEQDIRSVVLHDDSVAATVKTTHNGVADHKLQASRLADALVLNQIDAKFVLAVVPMQDSPALMLVDQHAADERIKVEGLYRQLCSRDVVVLMSPIKFEVTAEDQKRFAGHQETFTSWGIEYTLTRLEAPGRVADGTPTITVTRLPAIIAERCRVEPKILIELLRKEIWSLSMGKRTLSADINDSWIAKMVSCPEGLVDMVNSRACRTAIMFNDILTRGQCEGLLERLSQCTLPFQCAHGRPSMTILASLGGLDVGDAIGRASDFGDAYQRWCERECDKIGSD